MAVWIRIGKDTVGCEDGVVRRADFAALSRAEQIPEAAAAQAQDLLAQARREAQARMEAAEADSRRLRSEAQQIFAQAQMQGMSQGLRQASTEWAAKAIDAAGARRRHLHRGSERLSQVVSTAVEKIIGKEDPVKLFRRSLGTVLKLMHDAPLLTMKVHADDAQNAQAAVESLAGTLPEKLRIEVEVDADMPPGGCRFESDEGIIDTSLQTQLDALRRALDRTVTALASPEMADADEGLLDPAAPAALAVPEPLVGGQAQPEADQEHEQVQVLRADSQPEVEREPEPEVQPAPATQEPAIPKPPAKRALSQKPAPRTVAVKKVAAKPATKKGAAKQAPAKKVAAGKPVAKKASAKAAASTRAPGRPEAAKKKVVAARKAPSGKAAAPRAVHGSSRRKSGS